MERQNLETRLHFISSYLAPWEGSQNLIKLNSVPQGNFPQRTHSTRNGHLSAPWADENPIKNHLETSQTSRQYFTEGGGQHFTQLSPYYAERPEVLLWTMKKKHSDWCILSNLPLSFSEPANWAELGASMFNA